MSIFQKLVLVIAIIGAVVLGMIGLFSFNLIEFLFGEMTFLTRILYTVIGLSGVIALTSLSERRHHRASYSKKI